MVGTVVVCCKMHSNTEGSRMVKLEERSNNEKKKEYDKIGSGEPIQDKRCENKKEGLYHADLFTSV